MNELIENLGYSYYIHENCFITIHSNGNMLWILKNLDNIHEKYGPNLGYSLKIPIRKELSISSSSIFGYRNTYDDMDKETYLILEIPIYR